MGEQRIEGWLGEKLEKWASLLVNLFFTQCVAGIGVVLFGEDHQLRDPSTRAVVCASFLLWGFLYYTTSLTHWKAIFGVVQIAVGLGADWYQLGKLAELGVEAYPERIFFLAAGLAVVAHGWKDVIEGSAMWEKKLKAKYASTAP